MTTKPAQPAPAGATAAPASGTAAGATKVNHSPSEVAWMFVREYYHYLNRDPSRLHLFYGKDSAAIHGMEGDHADPAHGQAEIQKMLAAQSFKEARVVISSVDSLLSVNDGVVVQVLGELSNAGNPSQKFVQTFFLAKQPAGFFVLNDVFRYLCEDVEDEGADLDSAPIQQHHVAAAPESAAPAAPTVVEKANKPKSREPSPVKPKSPERRRPVSPAPAAAAPEPVAAPALVEQAKPRALSPAPAAAAQPSQAVTPAEQKPKSREPSPKRAKSPGKPVAAEPVAAEPKKEQAKPATAAPAPAQRAKSPAKPAPPAKPATWATLAAKAPAASSSTGSSPAPTPAPPAGASPRSQSPAVSSAAAPAEPVVRAVDSTPAAAPTASSSALQVYGSPGQESQQPGGRNPNFHVDVDKSVYLRLPYPAFETATPEFLVSSLPAGVTVKAITYQRQAAVLHLGSAEEAKAVLGTKLTMNGNTTTVEVRREGGAPGGRTGYGSGQGYRGGYQGGMGRGGSYGGGAQGAGPRPGSSGGVPQGAGGYGGAQQGSGEFGGRGGAMGGRGGRGRGGAAPTRA